MDSIPKDPFILLSYINTQLRDHYGTLDEFCRFAGVLKAEIFSTLSGIGYHYEPAQNQFR